MRAPRAGAEIEPIAIHDAYVRFRVENMDSRRDEGGRKAVIGIQRENVSPSRRANPVVARRREAGVGLVNDAIAGFPQSIEHFDRSRLG